MICDHCAVPTLYWICPYCNGTGKPGKWVTMHGQKIWVTLCPPGAAMGHTHTPTIHEIDARISEPVAGGWRATPTNREDRDAYK